MDPNVNAEELPAQGVSTAALEARIRDLEAVIAALKPASGPLVIAPRDGVLLDSAPPNPPQGAVLRPPEMFEAVRRGWLLYQFWTELRLIPQMYFDPRYRLSRTGQFALPGALVLLVLNYFFFHYFPIPVLGTLLEYVGAMIVGVLLYQVIVREAARYRQVLDYLQRYGFR